MNLHLKPIIFATCSLPRRRILEGFKFKNSVDFVPSDFDEDQGDKSTIDYCLDTAKGKAELVFKLNQNAVVVGFDTMILLEGELIGKPKGRDNAKEIFGKLSGKWYGH
jgi:septum formation protein